MNDLGFLDGIGTDLGSFENPGQQQQPQQQQNYNQQPQQQQQNYQQPQQQQQNYGNQNQGGYNSNSGGGNHGGKSSYGNNNFNNRNFRKYGFNRQKHDFRTWGKEEHPAYKPVAVFFDRDQPAEVKEQLIQLCDRLISRGYTVRFTADDEDTVKRITAMSEDNTEAYQPWKGFNEIETRFNFNHATSKAIAREVNPGFEKLPKIVQALIGRNVRMLFGQNNSSIVSRVIFWSPDGVDREVEITEKTGRNVESMLRLALHHNYPVINVNSEHGKEALTALFK